MGKLIYFKNKIKEKRKETNFQDYLKEVASWCPLSLQKINGMVSRFPDTKRIKKVIPSTVFEEKRDELLKKGLDYDFDIGFFNNFNNLFQSIDLGNICYGGNENSDYADMIFNSKKSYISFIVINNCENVLYSVSVKDNCKDVINGLSIWDSSNIIYQSAGILKSFKIFYSRYIINSSNVWFSSNLIGCSECIFCDDLENQKYCINNKQLEKEEYLKQKEEILKSKKNFYNYFNKVKKIGKNLVSENVDGNYIVNSENIEKGYYCSNVNTGRNLILVGGVDGDENMYDTFTGGAPYGNEFYGVMGANGDNLYNSVSITLSSNIFYSFFLQNCSFCIGCVGLKNKSYCILNKQYSKDEWEKLADEIFSQMDKDGILGVFFPGSLNPFYFNDTVAGLLGDFKKEEIKKEGYMWRDKEIKVDIPEGVEILEIKDLNNYQGFNENGNWQINSEILKKVIKDKKGNYYRIVKIEYDFLVKNGLPIPETHWLDRIKLNFGI